MSDETPTAEPQVIHSDEIGELAAAMAAAQAEFPAIKKTHTATVVGQTAAGKPYKYEYTYADLTDVLDATRPALSKHGLAVTQPIVRAAYGPQVVTMLLHKSGQKLQSEYSLRLAEGVKDSPQAWGSAITYARRYSLCGLLGVAGEEDDDGTAATAPGETTRGRTRGDSSNQPKSPAAQPAANVEKAPNIAQLQAKIAELNSLGDLMGAYLTCKGKFKSADNRILLRNEFSPAMRDRAKDICRAAQAADDLKPAATFLESAAAGAMMFPEDHAAALAAMHARADKLTTVAEPAT